MTISQAKMMVSLIAIILYTILILSLRLKILERLRLTERLKKLTSWWVGFGFTLLIVASISYITNPRGYFPTEFFPTRFLDTPPWKVKLYQGLTYDPDVVVVGSSRAHTLTAQTFKQITDLTFFNGSNSNSSNDEVVMFLRFMADTEAVEFPEVLLVEITVANDSREHFVSNSTLWPLSTTKYMPPDVVVHTLMLRARGLVSLEHMAEGMHVVSRVLKEPFQPKLGHWTLYPDGSLIPEKPTEEELAEILADIGPPPSCDSVSERYQQFIECKICNLLKSLSS